MFPRLRTIALLMLLAGLSLGIFTARALRAFGEADHPARTDGRLPRIELLVDLYQRDYHLTNEQADRVRRELHRHDRAVDAKIWELRQRHAEDFEDMRQVSYDRVMGILEEAENKR